MSLATDILRQHIKTLPKVHKPRIFQESDFEYTYGYESKTRGHTRTLTWLIPLAQLKEFCRNAVSGSATVWPWVHTSEVMMKRQVMRAHHMARNNGWKIKTTRLSKGLRITYLGRV